MVLSQKHSTKRSGSADALYDEHWLLAYEANVKGWLPSVSGTDHVAADPNFGFLKIPESIFLCSESCHRGGTLPTITTSVTFTS
jgi:hypothetical protein